MEVVGELVQDLCQFLNVGELMTSGEFPEEMERFKSTLQRVEQFKSAKLQISADVAESINNVKALVRCGGGVELIL
jgi:Bardet-Biedl syndrome 2 protein